MAETENDEDQDNPKKGSKMPFILGLVLALLGGGGGFYATWSGMLLAPETETDAKAASKEKDSGVGDTSESIAYVPVEPLVISLRAPSNAQHLRFRAHLEVASSAQAEVEAVLPRVVDVLNSYLRALEPADLEDPAALARLRAQMLRRVQVVTGLGKVNDLLIMEFVLT